MTLALVQITSSPYAVFSDMTTLAHLAVSGTEIAARATPNAARSRIDVKSGQIRIWVTCVPEGGKANKAVQVILAKALGVAKTRLTLIRGATSREKVFRLD